MNIMKFYIRSIRLFNNNFIILLLIMARLELLYVVFLVLIYLFYIKLIN